MDFEEFKNRQELELRKLPPHFRGPISFYAYEKSHAWGYEEVLNTVTSLVNLLVPLLKKDG